MSRLTSGPGLKPRVSAAVLRAQTDRRLAALARDGNEQAFAAIFDRYARELHAHARRIVRADRADDVVQHAMLRAWTSMPHGPEISDLRAWLHRIVRNRALDQVAKRSYNEGGIPLSTPAPLLTEARAETRITADAILAAVAALSENQRRALTLTALEGLSGRETAQTMGVSETAVRQLVRRARTTVRSAVSAITPLPLVAWAGEIGPEAVSRGAAAGLGGGAGLAAGALKVAAVLGIGGTTLATVTYTQQQHHHRPAIRATHAGAAASVRGGDRTVVSSSILQAFGAASNTERNYDRAQRKRYSVGEGARGSHGSASQSVAHDGSSGEQGSSRAGQSRRQRMAEGATGVQGEAATGRSAHSASDGSAGDSGKQHPGSTVDGPPEGVSGGSPLH